ncbi:BACON domain-containing protein [Marinifilum fragile]|uniref:BACON domain-containing protein n=1 Tax=Marinifilum fragile TaxID=570161 RepID=UPI002AABE93B|nr:BACON domain-containing protein [Marinifilum fragile]
MKRQLLLLIIVFSLKGFVFSQETDFGKILPPSPEATSFAKFTDIPVRHYTGLPQISIPFYSIEIDGIKIPIALSYHARGIAVEEVASRVGIGWALNAGGAVVRQTRGKPDDLGQGYLQYDYYKTIEEDEATRLWVFEETCTDRIDLEPDQFSFNFLGYSGKFYFDQRSDPKQIVLEQFSDIEIEPIFENENNYWRLLGWIITTDNGFKYYFGLPKNQNDIDRIARSNDKTIDYRCTTNSNSQIGGEISAVYNSWQLIDIVSPIGNIIRFNYKNESPVFYRKSYDAIENDGGMLNRCVSYFSKVSTVQSQLESIEFDGGLVKFHEREDLEREDLKGAHYLEYIEVVNNLNSTIKKFRLDYSYSHDTSTDNVLFTLNKFDPHAAKRMFLDSITEIGGNKQLPPYKFSYTNKNNLPNRFSTSQDYWGYYNGKNNGQFLNIDNAQELADDKSVDPSAAKIGLLNRIDYPTGGYVDYIFESNKAIPPSYFNDLLFNQVNPTVSKNAGLFKNYEQRVSNCLYESEPFTIENDVIGYLHSNVNSWGTNTNTARIVDSNGSVVMNLYEGSHDLLAGALIPGTYKIRVNVSGFDDPYDLDNSFSVTINWEEENVSQYEEIYCGGNRIKEVELNDAKGGSINRRYEYLDKNGNSSGLIYALPCYSFVSTITGDGVHHAGVLKPGSPLVYNQGNHLGYSMVTEYIVNNYDNEGKTQYIFTCMNDVGEFWKFPYTIPDDNESYRGKPLRIDYYEKKNGPKPYALIRRTNYNYQVYGESEYSGTTYPFVEPDAIKPLLSEYEVDSNSKFCLPLIVFGGDSPLTEYHNYYEMYYLRGGTMQLKSIQNIDYFGNDIVESLETFEYDNVNNYQQVESQKTSSDGKNVITRNFYPHDYPNVPELDLLKQRNIISKPVDVRTYIDNKLVSGQQIKYNNSGLPIEVYQFEGSGVDIPFNSYTPYTFSHKQSIGYTSKGKIREIEKVSGEVSSFLWAYNNQYLLAKIENASYSEVESVLGGLSAVNNLGLSEDEIYILSYIDLLRNSSSLNDTQITSYTYDPLKGISSEKGPNNISTYYEYDEFGRLMKVKNDDEELLQVYQYHYSDGEAIALELSLSVTSLDFKIIGGTSNVNVTSNSTWTVSDDSNWISVSPSSGSNNGTINITCDGNPTSNLRRGTVTVSCGNISKTISISQKSGLLLK